MFNLFLEVITTILVSICSLPMCWENIYSVACGGRYFAFIMIKFAHALGRFNSALAMCLTDLFFVCLLDRIFAILCFAYFFLIFAPRFYDFKYPYFCFAHTSIVGGLFFIFLILMLCLAWMDRIVMEWNEI